MNSISLVIKTFENRGYRAKRIPSSRMILHYRFVKNDSIEFSVVCGPDAMCHKWPFNEIEHDNSKYNDYEVACIKYDKFIDEPVGFVKAEDIGALIDRYEIFYDN